MPTESRIMAPSELVPLSRAVTSKPVSSCSSGASVDKLFVSVDVYRC